MSDQQDAEKVFEFFSQVSSVPRGSGNTKGISDFLVDFAEKRGLEHYQDEKNNVIIYKDASEGYEDAAPVILQGHMDMVCEKVPGSKHDFTKDPIDMKVEGDWITADGTTLGGDDGVAMAMILTVLDSDTLKHPAIEAVIT
ncbi:MAG: aminoacyl-histidine dipeptidase, partial [Anaerovoracaceae bacterium]